MELAEEQQQEEFDTLCSCSMFLIGIDSVEELEAWRLVLDLLNPETHFQCFHTETFQVLVHTETEALPWSSALVSLPLVLPRHVQCCPTLNSQLVFGHILLDAQD